MPEHKALLDQLAQAINALEEVGLGVGPLLEEFGYGLCVCDKDAEEAYHFTQQSIHRENSWDWEVFIPEPWHGP